MSALSLILIFVSMLAFGGMLVYGIAKVIESCDPEK